MLGSTAAPPTEGYSNTGVGQAAQTFQAEHLGLAY
jgi:hypothetical protein